MKKVTIIDYGLSNLLSVQHAFAHFGAETLVTMCPTCTYTVAQACLESPGRAIGNRQYLELLFGETIDWAQVFDQLGSMWTGEYGPWLMQTLY